MELNQPYYLNIVFLKIFLKENFFKLGRLGKPFFFTKCSKYPVPGLIQLQVRSIQVALS